MEIKLVIELTREEYLQRDEKWDNMVNDKVKNEWIRVVDNEEVRVEDYAAIRDQIDGYDRYFVEVWIDVDVQDLWRAAQKMRTRLNEYES